MCLLYIFVPCSLQVRQKVKKQQLLQAAASAGGVVVPTPAVEAVAE